MIDQRNSGHHFHEQTCVADIAFCQREPRCSAPSPTPQIIQQNHFMPGTQLPAQSASYVSRAACDKDLHRPSITEAY